LGQQKNITQLIQDQGYPCENYVVETSDGFLLNIQRIPFGRKGPTSGPRPVAFLQHGLLDSAAAWVINLPEESLGYILADAGFDVFLGNVRGNTWSSNNTKYSNKNQQYWDLIDFDYMIQVDLPTMIDKALMVSGRKSLVYIGHSQGTVMGFGGFPSNPQLASKVDIFIALAPVAWVNHQTSFLLTILSDLDAVLFFEYFGVKDFLPNSWLIQYLGGTVCEEVPFACADFIFLLCGWDTTNLNDTRIPLYTDYTPAGTSVKNMAHWAQMVSSGEFQMYDYGVVGNIQHYNSTRPPKYHPENMTSPKVAFFTGTKDDLADPKDVQHLLSALPASNKPLIVNVQPTYEHLDFTWGENAHQLIYPQVVDLAKKYSSN
jgi:lysosomal acid lipase/cholesteryl ester hydrolase